MQPCVDQGRNTYTKHANYSIKTSVQCIDVVLTGIMGEIKLFSRIFEMPIAMNGGGKSMLSTAVSM